MDAQILEGHREQVLAMQPLQCPRIGANRSRDADAPQIGSGIHAPSVIAMTSISLTQEALDSRVTHRTISIRSCGGIMSRLSCGLEAILPSFTVIVPILPGLRHVTAMPSLRTTSRKA